jgi:predicted RNA binding protein YcfA (HicA-like mRNA interferase family)
MTVREFRRWLKKQGCTFVGGKRHDKVVLGNRKSVISRHMTEEIKTGTVEGIKEDLGLKGVK